MSAFDFSRAGTPGDGTQRRRARDRSAKKLDILRAVPLVRPLSNNPLRPSGPIRRTCGVIKLPVVHVRDPSPPEVDGQDIVANIPESSAKESGVPETPKLNPLSPIPITTSSEVVVPALWENRLLGVKACDYETGDDIILPALSTEETTKPSESTIKLLTTSAGTNQSRVPGVKSPLSSPVGGALSASLLAQQLQASLKQAVGLSGGSSVIPSLLQRTTALKNGQSKDNALSGLNKKKAVTAGSLGRVEGKKMIENLSRMVTDNDLRLQEEKVRHLRQQLLAAEKN